MLTVENQPESTTQSLKTDISVVVPVYNEVENVGLLAEKIMTAMSVLGKNYEIVFVDDGSSDGTDVALKELAIKHPFIKVVKFRRNFGQTPAMAAGFDYASGEIIVTMDGDLQNDPADVGRIIEELENGGYDVVSGWRKDRKDAVVSRKIPSMIANRIISRMTGVSLHDYGCSLKAYRKEIAKELPMYGELHRFIPALAAIEGAKIKEMPVNHHARQFGQSKYNILRTFKVILDLMTVVFLRKFMTRPLHVFGRMGLLSLFVGGCISMYLALDKIILGDSIGNRPLLLLGAILIISGIQLISTGIIGEILIRTYYESQGKKIYKVKEVHNLIK